MDRIDRIVSLGYGISEDEYNSVVSTFDKNFKWNGDSFFHWELEFPEIKISEGGFSCIIGNPPYVIVDEESYKVSIKKTITTKSATDLTGKILEWQKEVGDSVSLEQNCIQY